VYQTNQGARYVEERKSFKTKINKLSQERDDAIRKLELYEELIPKIEAKMDEGAYHSLAMG
jgi:hypothetical protein